MTKFLSLAAILVALLTIKSRNKYLAPILNQLQKTLQIVTKNHYQPILHQNKPLKIKKYLS